MVTPILLKYTAPETLVYPQQECGYQSPVLCLSILWFVLKLESVTIEKSNQATLNMTFY